MAEIRKLGGAAADLIKVNGRPSAASINKANLIWCYNIQFAAIALDLRSDALHLHWTSRGSQHCCIVVMAQSRLTADASWRVSRRSEVSKAS